MHIYIYGSNLSQKKYQKTLAKIETQLTDLGLNGRIYRLGPISKVDEVVNGELRKDPKTIVIVGNDFLVNEVINLLAENKVPIGIIPVGEPNNIAKGLGIDLENACQVLSARRVLKFDLGLANNHYFVNNAKLAAKDLSFKIDNKYSFSLTGHSDLEIVNFSLNLAENNEIVQPDPTDGELNLFLANVHNKLLKKETSQSFIALKRLVFDQKTENLILDGVYQVSEAKEINVLKQSINLIIGKNRSF